MLFHSQPFVVFFLAVFFVHWTARRIWPEQAVLRKSVLLAASILFYASWNVPLISLLAGSVCANYLVGRRIAATGKRSWLAAGIFCNLSVLAVFKYADFGLSSIVAVLSFVGLSIDPVGLRVVLPLGISFYTFQATSYIFDIYRGKYRPDDSLLDCGLYITFFPQLVAGPIVRVNTFYGQLSRDRSLRWPFFYHGISLFVLGVFKKIVLADQAAAFANPVFASAAEYPGFLILVGVYAFAFQIYFDFSAYTDMARGLGYLLGYRLPENFAHPYSAVGLRDFWRRWHISLSSWLRDYLYIPLGGSRAGAIATYRNLMITMLLGGLWHGASWTFVIWGGIHGVFLASERLLWEGGLKVVGAFPRFLVALVTFHIVCLCWVFFRAQSVNDALLILQSIVWTQPFWDAGALGLFKLQNWMVGFLLPALIVLGSYFHQIDKSLVKYPLWFSILFFVCVLSMVALVSAGANEFIYFQF